jgi:hypothetical protein
VYRRGEQGGKLDIEEYRWVFSLVKIFLSERIEKELADEGPNQSGSMLRAKRSTILEISVEGAFERAITGGAAL